VIDEQINQKDSMEDISFNIMNNKCKKQNIAKMVGNHFRSVASGEIRTTDIEQSRALSDPRSQKVFSNKILNQTLQGRREVKPKILKTLNLYDKNKSCLQPIGSK
jgi:hypothetical protein